MDPEDGTSSVGESQPSVESSSCQDGPVVVGKKRTIVYEPGMARIKEEFIDYNHKGGLDATYLPKELVAQLQPTEGSKEKENDSTDEPPKKKFKAKGRFKKRPHDKRQDASKRPCNSIINGNPCRFGEKCRFLHDKDAYIASKPAPLGDKCYSFETYGHCPFGITCMYAVGHLNEKHENITNKEKYVEGKGANSDVRNVLQKNIQISLRKREYDFKKANAIVDSVKNYKPPSSNQKEKVESKPGDTTGVQSIESTDKEAKTENDIQEKSTHATDNQEQIQDAEKPPLAPEITADEEKSATGIEDGAVAMETSEPAKNGHVKNGDAHLGCVLEEDLIKLRDGEKKKVDFRDKLYLAPLTTVGNLPFRRVCRALGADITCSEMATCSGLLQGTQSEWALLKRHPCEDVYGVQLCGAFPDVMTRTAQLLTEKCHMDFVDINSGCPIDMFYKKGEGCGLMNSTTKMSRIIKAMTSVLEVPLTVKMRTGINEGKNTAHILTPKLRDWGVSLLTLHGRSREQRYTRLADWHYIDQCAAAAKPMPVFGNGDILSYEDYAEHRQHTGVAGCMIARGALIKPWLFTEIKEERHWDISASERLDILRDFANYGLEHWGSDQQGVATTRKFLLEWLSFLYRYIPVGVLEQPPQRINEKPPFFLGRNDLESLMASGNSADWVRISEMLLGPVPADFTFLPKHKANAYR